MERKASRLYYLDWLRVLGVLAVTLYHTTHRFSLEHDLEMVVTTDTWQVRGTAGIASERPAGLVLLQQPGAP